MLILVVDDRADIGLLMICLVTHAGHEGLLAGSGRGALKLAAEFPPDVVLLDINMPGMDGYETAQGLRGGHGDQLPIFAVSGDVVDVCRAAQSGINGIFSKPFSATKLDALLSQLS